MASKPKSATRETLTVVETPRQNIVISSIGDALKHALEPIIASLDKFAPTEMGHELPSRKDGLLRILTNNLCRDFYQQIHGVNTANYKFAGVKDNYDRAQAAVSRLVSDYSNHPEDLDADPNCTKFLQWHESAGLKMEFLRETLADLEELYYDITGEKWVYVEPGTKKPTVNNAEAANILRDMMAKNAK